MAANGSPCIIAFCVSVVVMVLLSHRYSLLVRIGILVRIGCVGYMIDLSQDWFFNIIEKYFINIIFKNNINTTNSAATTFYHADNLTQFWLMIVPSSDWIWIPMPSELWISLLLTKLLISHKLT